MVQGAQTCILKLKEEMISKPQFRGGLEIIYVNSVLSLCRMALLTPPKIY